MARLAAVERGLYYPTDLRVIELYRQHHFSFSDSVFNAIDFCSGEGSALREIVKGTRARTYGIEIEEARANAGKEILTKSVHSALEDVEIEGDIQFAFLNMPYADGINGRREELNWIDMVAPYLENNRTMVLVLPEMFVEGGKYHNEFRTCLYRNNLKLCSRKTFSYSYDEKYVGAFKFPEPEFQQFKQYIIAVRKPSWNEQVLMMPAIHVEGVIGECSVRIEAQTKSYHSEDGLFFYRKERTEIESVLLGDLISIFGRPDDEIPIQPLQPMIPEILAAMIAGGIFTGIQMGNSVVRGGTTIEVIETETQEDGVRKKYETSKMHAHVVELNLETGELLTTKDTEDAFGSKVEMVANKLKDIVRVSKPSIFQEEDVEKYRPLIERIHAPRAIKGVANGLFAAQIRSAGIMLKAWETTKSVILMGEVGVGKTVTSIAAATSYVANRKSDAQKILILLPSKNDLVAKWKEEIALSCRDLKPKIVDVETISGVQKAFAHEGLTFVLVKESMVKRTSGWDHLEKRRKYNGKSTCWNCGAEAELFNKDGKVPEKPDELLFCGNCNASYRTDVRDRNKNAYASLARYISKHYAGSYVLIADEAHQYKGGDTARGYAAGHLMTGAKRLVLMTGTFYNGYASSMFFNTYRSQSTFRQIYGYDSLRDFIQLYGLEQKITTEKKKEGRYSWSGYNINKTVMVKEIPGIHPAMIALLLPYTLFMKIQDLDFSIPPSHQHTLFLDLPKSARDKVDEYLDDILNQAKQDMRDKPPSMSLMSQWTWARLGAYDMYPLGDKVDDFDLAGIDADKLAPKEEATLRIVQKHKAMGHPTLIYYGQTDRRPIHHRLSRQFEERGMKLVYMPSTVKNRKAFIEKALVDGADAVICNPNLVREGIDLLMFKAIIWYSTENDAILVSQANGRIARIGQDFETHVYYLGYNGTYQSDRWAVTAKKVAAMAAIHGDVRSGLAALLGDDDLISTIQNHLIEFERQDSDLSMNDLPELQVLDKNVPAKKSEPVMTWYEWKALNNVTSTQPTRRVKTKSKGQMNLF